MKKYLYLLLMISTAVSNSYAANNLVVYKAATGTYTDLTGASDVTTAVITNDSFNITTLSGEQFQLYGKSVTLQASSMMILQNGRIQFSEDTAFSIIDVLYAENLEPIDNTSSISYKIDGSGSNKILKVQWKNMKVSTGPAGNFLNVQTWIYQQTGIIEFRYGPRSANNASGYTVAATGLYAGIWYSDYSLSNIYEKMELVGAMPNFTIDSVLNQSVVNVEGVPAEGTILRFVPKKVATSVSAMGKDHLRVFPNPAGNELTVSLPGVTSTPIAISLTDMAGHIVYSGTISPAADKYVIPTTLTPTGIYQLSIKGAGISSSSTVTIQH